MYLRHGRLETGKRSVWKAFDVAVERNGKDCLQRNGNKLIRSVDPYDGKFFHFKRILTENNKELLRHCQKKVKCGEWGTTMKQILYSEEETEYELLSPEGLAD